MNWLIRFQLGLPARAEDVAELRATIPEILSGDWEPNKRHIQVHALLLDIWPHDGFSRKVRRWASEVCEEQAEPDNKSSLHCRSETCPLRKSGTETNASASESQVLNLIVAAGGPDAKPPRDSFFDLVRKVHRGLEQPREVILTDPYIYSDVSEDGLTGGFSNLVQYLEVLGLKNEDSFCLVTTPSPKRGGKTAQSNLRRLLKKTFKDISFRDFSPELAFHDRFYLARHRSGALKGVFGPSLNGLSSKSIVLMGDIDELQPLKKLNSWLG